MRKLLQETTALAWTLGGTGLVLITLSGDTQKIGVWITIASIVIHMANVFIPWDKKKKSESDQD